MKKGKVILDFTDFGNREWKDRLHGGKADNETPEDFDPDDIAIGTAIEREHSNNPDIATEISMDHDQENDTYYDELIMAGIADEKEAIDIFNRVKTIDDKKSAIDKIQRHLNKEKRELDIEDDYMNEEPDEDYDDEDMDDYDEDEELEDDVDYEEDDLGTDKADVEDDELIIDDDEIKNKKHIMEKSVKNYKSFIRESADTPEPEQPVVPEEVAPERKFSKENKYKFQLPYDKKVVDKLGEYNFTFYTPEGEKPASKPTKDTHSIIIDILNLTYSVVDTDHPEIRTIDSSRLKHLLDNL